MVRVFVWCRSVSLYGVDPEFKPLGGDGKINHYCSGWAVIRLRLNSHEAAPMASPSSHPCLGSTGIDFSTGR